MESPLLLPRPHRILVVGTSGTGKSTLAGKLSLGLRIRDVELDDLYWNANWVPSTNEVFVEKVRRVIEENETWVIHGNYGQSRPLTWPRATALIWLDYSFPLTFARATRRTALRWLRREELWSARNRESLRKTLFTKDSILWWVIQTWGRRRRELPALLARPEYAHLKVYRFRTPAETEAFLAENLSDPKLTSPRSSKAGSGR